MGEFSTFRSYLSTSVPSQGWLDTSVLGLGHDLRNSSTCAIAAMRLALHRAQGASDETTAGLLRAGLGSLERAIRLVDELASGTAPARPPHLVWLQSALPDLRPTLALAAGRRLALSTLISSDTPPLRCDLGTLERALLDLVINAREAVPGIAPIRLEAGRCLEHGAHRKGAGCVRVSVHDTGPGMSEHVAREAFRAFFTTKSAGSDRGLGLARVKCFAEQLGGSVEMRTGLGAGTVVHLHLPHAAASGDAVDRRRS